MQNNKLNIMKMKEQILSEFTKRFEGTPVVYASSGRINLIGEHTDYNGGFVFPGAIDKYIMAAILPNGSDKVRVFSIDINDYAEFGLNEEDAPEAQWSRSSKNPFAIKRSGKIGRASCRERV